MTHIFYKDFGVTALVSVKWIRGVEKEGFLNLLWVPHYNRAPINLIMINNCCVWCTTMLVVGKPIPITDMLIHKITLLSHSKLNPAKAFGGKLGEHNLTERIKDKFKRVKKSRKYSISSITNPTVK